MAAVGGVLAAVAAGAQSFEPALDLTTPGTRGDNADVATDGRGNVVVTWWIDNDDSPFGRDADVVLARSTDGGATWSAPALIDPAAASDSVGTGEVLPRILTDGQGTWLALWVRWLSAGPSNPDGVFAARSIDAGATWSRPVRLGAVGDAGGQLLSNNGRLAACSDGRGTWLVVVPQDGAAQIARSVDGGQTWGTEAAPTGLIALASCERRPVGLIATALDGSTPSELRAVRAGADGRFAGSASVLIDRRESFNDHARATLAADPAGRLVATWRVDQQIFAASSADGATWSPPTALPTPSGFVFNGAAPFVANGGVGRWLILWGGPRPRDNVLASTDGQTWAQTGSRDGWYHAVTPDGAGGWMAVWQTSLTKQVFFAHARGEAGPPPTGPCEGLRCRLQETLATACPGVKLPARLRKDIEGLVNLAERAAAANTAKQQKLLAKRVQRRLKAVRAAIARHGRRRHPKVPGACGQALVVTLSAAS
ncbi:MAG: sialidase family protein [Candidatus Binatia bacterium]